VDYEFCGGVFQLSDGESAILPERLIFGCDGFGGRA
jgi:hypothetical protein